jgi:hypothetical protein
MPSPRIILADHRAPLVLVKYDLLISEMVAHTHDSHCFVSGGVLPNGYAMAAPPLEVRWIENLPLRSSWVPQRET